MSRTCNVKDMIVVLNRLVLNLLPDSMRLSSNIGFSYHTVREPRHRPHPLCSRSFELFSPANSCLCGQINDFTPHGPDSDLNFFFRLRRPAPRPQRHSNRLLAAPAPPVLV